MNRPTYLKNHEAVLQALGGWSWFHDSHVLAFEHSGECIKLSIHAFEMTDQTDERGYFILTKHHQIHFTFEDVDASNLAGFTADNILFELGFSSPADYAANQRFEVIMDSAMGSELNGSFTASRGEVSAVIPCDEKGQALVQGTD